MDLKQKLAGAQWRLHVERTILVDDEQVPVVLRRPPMGVLLAAMEEARKGGEVDAAGTPVDGVGAMRFMARLTALCLFAPGGLRPMFGKDDMETLLAVPWLSELQDDINACVASVTKLVEVAKGNSEATPS